MNESLYLVTVLKRVRLQDEILNEWGIENKMHDEYIFPILNGYKLDSLYQLKRAISSRNSYFNKILKEIIKQTDIQKNVHWHMSRHSNATIGLSKGIRMDVLSKLLGHSDLKTTQIYGKIVDDLKDKAMELWD